MTGIVQVFVGTSDSEADFRRYFDRAITEDGDILPSQFMIDVGIEKNEPDCEEILWQSHCAPARLLLRGCSYLDQFINQLSEISGNCAALLYEASPARDPGSANQGLTHVGIYEWEHR